MQVLSCFTLFIFEFGKFRKDFGKFSEMSWKILDFFGIPWNFLEELGRERHD